MIRTVNQEVCCCDMCGRILGSVDIKTFLDHYAKIENKFKVFCNSNCKKTYTNLIKEQSNK